MEVILEILDQFPNGVRRYKLILRYLSTGENNFIKSYILHLSISYFNLLKFGGGSYYCSCGYSSKNLTGTCTESPLADPRVSPRFVSPMTEYQHYIY